MKGLALLGAATGLLLCSSSPALASAYEPGHHTLTFGYAQSKVQDFKNIYGANVKYRYEWENSPFGVLGSLTYMAGSDGRNESGADYYFKEHTKLKYHSLAVGPTYRINDLFSLYGMVGVNLNKVDYSSSRTNYQNGGYVGSSNSSNNKTKASFMYGAGIQINPWENLAIDIGYEGSRVDINGKERSINGFNIGILAIVF
ncbi:Ail/Lom family outer membrane beta-barrel protein [Enterobacillus tribolii]|uniref:Putative virulence related protein PagC n=1 Tax=Enterobacillus tribolii TaxID=1487935 RepID=A0A370QSB5_9GAMM|nr:Ail/Lom family outer membrane beta-barrel protein [Enterobacillus tribolii]RDK92152.1 putative virulence related protein PagC [Enterobacillus tribolii]